MILARLPGDEPRRIERLKRFAILDTPPEESFDRITRIVAETVGVPIALVSLIDTDRQWFKSRYSLAVTPTSRETAFCAHTILEGNVLVVEDARKDERFNDNPLVTGAPNIRFYAGGASDHLRRLQDRQPLRDRQRAPRTRCGRPAVAGGPRPSRHRRNGTARRAPKCG
jgi:hypothetical protein